MPDVVTVLENAASVGKNTIGGKLEAFRWKILERLRSERRDQPYEVHRVSLSHTRSEAFAPHILDSTDSADIL